jgi:hypothetical protein
MKPLFIEIKKNNLTVAAINSQDIKAIKITDKNVVTVFLSEEDVTIPKMTSAAITKLRKEILSRYDILQIGKNGISCNRNDHRNTVISTCHNEHTWFIFPKALHSISVNNGICTIDGFGIHIDVHVRNFNAEDLTELLQVSTVDQA